MQALRAVGPKRWVTLKRDFFLKGYSRNKREKDWKKMRIRDERINDKKSSHMGEGWGKRKER